MKQVSVYSLESEHSADNHGIIIMDAVHANSPVHPEILQMNAPRSFAWASHELYTHYKGFGSTVKQGIAVKKGAVVLLAKWYNSTISGQ